MEIKVKVSSIVSKFIREKNITHTFSISGGASLHLIHSIEEVEGLTNICCHHEQGCAMAADGYARVTGRTGLAIATSGPGATNLITGICCSYYDSVPMMAITGQVSRFRMIGKSKVRQIGFQETPIVELCKSITKYAVRVTKAENILYELEKAYQIANAGRKGPVLVDIPDDVQREYILASKCKIYKNKIQTARKHEVSGLESRLDAINKLLRESERPVIIAGWGVHLAQAEKMVRRVIEQLNIPVALTWGAADLIETENQLYLGTFGTHGQRCANLAVQNADLILCMGARLDTKATGTPIATFAPKAKKIVIDIDKEELKKFDEFDLYIEEKICEDLNILKDKEELIQKLSGSMNGYLKWKKQISEWRTKTETFDRGKRNEIKSLVNPYHFFEIISDELEGETNIFLDTGCTIAWAMQSIKMKSGIRTYHDFNNTAMGWALPASIGAKLADTRRNTVCIMGDGSLMMTMEELAIIKRFKINLKVIVMNNSGYSMIQQTQDQWLDSKYIASSYEGGIDFPNLEKIADAFEMDYEVIDSNKDLEHRIKNIIDLNGPVLCDVKVERAFRVIPQVKAGYPNEKMEPEYEI